MKLITLFLGLLMFSCNYGIYEEYEDYLLVMEFDSFKKAEIIQEYFNSEAIGKVIFENDGKYYIEIESDELDMYKADGSNTLLISNEMRRNIIKMKLIKIGDTPVGDGVIN